MAFISASLQEATSTTHTPGPWTAQHLHVVARGCGDLKADGYNDHCIVERVDGRSKDEAIANAVLIAAAPEMLEALRDIEANLTGRDCFPERVADSLQRAQNAIALATGKGANKPDPPKGYTVEIGFMGPYRQYADGKVQKL